MVRRVEVFRGIETVGGPRAANHGELERHRGVTVGDVGLGKAGQIPLLPTEGVVQRQRRAGDFARGTGGCRGPNHTGLGESAARIGSNRG